MITALRFKGLMCLLGSAILVLGAAAEFGEKERIDEGSNSQPCNNCKNFDLYSFSTDDIVTGVCNNQTGLALIDCLLMECDKAKSKNNLVHGPNPVCPQTNGACTTQDENFQQSPGTCLYSSENDALVNQINPNSSELNDTGCSFYIGLGGQYNVQYGSYCTYTCTKNTTPNPTPTPAPSPTPIPKP